MRKLLIFLIIFLCSGCVPSGGSVTWGKSALYELKSGEEVYYFQYPESANVVEEGGAGYIEYNGCKVDFDRKLGVGVSENVDIKDREIENGRFEAWYKNNVLVLYAGFKENASYVFWVYDSENDVSSCMDFVDNIVNSFIDKPIYYNDKFSFKAEILTDYKLEYLPSGEGILMKKWISDNMCEDDFGQEYECGYKVEITLYGFENVMERADLANYILNEYSGYSAEFVNYGKNMGVFIDEALDLSAIRHFFVMSNDGDTICEAKMTVPNLYFARHKGEFDDFTETIEIF